MPCRILHVDLDAFFVEVCRRQLPALRDVAQVVVGGRKEGRGVVQSASYACRAFGVKAGMPVRQAARLCPDATFVKGEFAWYRAASRQVRDVLAALAPAVQMASLDEAYLDFTNTELLHPVSLLPVARMVRDRVREAAGLDVSIGIGPNRMVAKLASDYAKPRGLVEVRAGWERAFMAGLPLKAIPGIGPHTAERLRARGLVDVAQVQALALPDLERLVGDAAADLKLRCDGHGATVLRPDRAPKSVSRETTLPEDEAARAPLEALLGRLVAKVAYDLRSAGLEARTVVLKLRHGDFVTVTRRVTLARATDLDAELERAAQPLLAAAFDGARRRGQGVRLLGVAATNLVAAATEELFEDPARTRARDLARAVDRVRAKFGYGAVGDARASGREGRPE
ncbi:MAG: DNA polymerase IV [Gemmatimonadales bacterium]|nr:DNA polymerase IV [Gemmatimonadales bacterium]